MRQTAEAPQNIIIIQVTNKEKRDEIAKKNAEIMGSEGDPFYGAPAMLIVLGKKTGRHMFMTAVL